MNKITAQDIVSILACKHSKDVFIPQCKTGPTQMAMQGELRIFDAWVMKKSWAHPCITGYEVKISRGDFLNDNKCRNYLDYCHEFYFVCPPKTIFPDELPPEAGLLYMAGSRFITKKKAPYRNIKIPENIYQYILMCRVTIGNENNQPSEQTYWQEWLKDRTIDQKLGYRVGKTLQKVIEEKILQVERKNSDLIKENNRLQEAKGILEQLGVNSYLCDTERQIKKKVEEINRGIPGGTMNCLSQAMANLQLVMNFFSLNKES